MAKGVIISADDSDLWSKAKEKILTKAGYHVETSSIIEDALVQLKNLLKHGIIPEAVVLDNDTRTPMKGVEAAKEIHISSPDTAIIILSGDIIPDSELQQADAVQMSKSSFSGKDLINLVKREIERHQRSPGYE